jgi:hypothetical protein
MICEKCKTAGDVNEMLDTAQRLSDKDRDAMTARAVQLHKQCSEHDCMCQHRIGVYVARGQEKGTSGSTPGNGGTGREDGAPSQGSRSEPQ